MTYDPTKKSIVIDFDGIIANDAFPKFGKLMPGVIKYIDELHNFGYYIIIWTVRTAKYWTSEQWEKIGSSREEQLSGLKKYLEENDIYYDEIWEQDKPNATFFIDDRSMCNFNFMKKIK